MIIADHLQHITIAMLLKLKLKLFTICTVCAGLHQIPYAPVAVSGPPNYAIHGTYK
jgi:hypothetical protein